MLCIFMEVLTFSKQLNICFNYQTERNKPQNTKYSLRVEVDLQG